MGVLAMHNKRCAEGIRDRRREARVVAPVHRNKMCVGGIGERQPIQWTAQAARTGVASAAFLSLASSDRELWTVEEMLRCGAPETTASNVNLKGKNKWAVCEQ